MVAAIPYVQHPRWSDEQLEADRLVALEAFKSGRTAQAVYASQFPICLAEVKALLEATSNLSRFTGTVFVSAPKLIDPARFLVSPPLSQDDLDTIVGRKIGKSVSEAVADRVAAVLSAPWEAARFPWVASDRSPSPAEVETAAAWTAGLMAVERTRTELRTQASKGQQDVVAGCLESWGYSERSRPKGRHISALDDLDRGTFVRNALLAGKDCDIAVRLHDGRLLAIECKVSNSSVNSVKRLMNDAGGKAYIWLRHFGAQVVPAAVLAGVFHLVNLTGVQKTHGLFVIWEHNLAPLKAFLDATTRPKAGT